MIHGFLCISLLWDSLIHGFLWDSPIHGFLCMSLLWDSI